MLFALKCSAEMLSASDQYTIGVNWLNILCQSARSAYTSLATAHACKHNAHACKHNAHACKHNAHACKHNGTCM